VLRNLSRRGRRVGLGRLSVVAEVLEQRQLLSGVTLAGVDGRTVVDEHASGAVARFANPDQAALLDHASIDWGDGTTTVGEVDGAAYWSSDPLFYGSTPITPLTSSATGVVEGSHTFAQAGTYTVKTSVVAHVLGQADQTIDTTATVTVEPISITSEAPLSILGAAGFSVVDRLATFESDFTTDPSTWTATIDWGDGSAPTTGKVSPEEYFYPLAYAAGGDAASSLVTPAVLLGGQGITIPPWAGAHAAVAGDHAYVQAGHFTATITVDDGQGRTATSTANIDVGASTLVLRGQENTVVADPIGAMVPSELILAKGFDFATSALNPGNDSDYHATINWGDGSAPTDGELGLRMSFDDDPSGRLQIWVRGTHTYAAQGDYSATVTLFDAHGHSTTATATIHALPETLTLDPAVAELTRGVPFYTVVARGFDSALGFLQDPTRLKATIDWGDGTAPTDGSVGIDYIASNGGLDSQYFTIDGGHAYAQGGTYTAHITITGLTGITATVDSTIKVGRFTGIASFGAVKDGDAFSTFGGGVVATVGTPGTDASPDGYTATIDWGDGSPVEAGTIVTERVNHEPWFAYETPPRTLLQVKGDHIYHGVGVHTLSVTVTDASGESHTFTNVVFVNPASGPPVGGDGVPGGPPIKAPDPASSGATGGAGATTKTADPAPTSTTGGSGATIGNVPTPVQPIFVPHHRVNHHAKVAHTPQVTMFGHPTQFLTGKAKAHALAISHKTR
jgi:hypothetical protein